MLPLIFGEETVGPWSPLHVRQAVKHQAMSYHGPERRSHKRYRADVRVREMVPGKQFFAPLTFGYGGISCLVDKTYSKDTLVVMEIDLQDGSIPFSAPARVVRVQDSAAGKVMAMRFMMPQMQLGPYFEKIK